MGRLFVENYGGETVFECKNCGLYLTNHEKIISQDFKGSTGIAFLFEEVANIKHGELQQRNMMTGKHFVRDVFCKCCDTKIGWMYEFAVDQEQQYKEGKVILEISFVNEVPLEPEPAYDDESRPPSSVGTVSSITIT